MLIGELSEKTGFSKDTIRFYEKKGLISVDKDERRDNNYKEYSEQVLERLNVIKVVKKLGFTLNEITRFLKAWEGDKGSCDNLTDGIQDKISAIDNEIRILNSVKVVLNDILASCDDKCEIYKEMPSCISKCT